MQDQTNSEQEQILAGFGKALDSHGYGFQYAVLKFIQSQPRVYNFPWFVEAIEVPVETQGSGTRIDLVLNNDRRPLFVLVECKRVNPALANWCFAKTSQELGYVVGEIVKFDQGKVETVGAHGLAASDNIFSIALEVKTGQKGDTSGHGREGIEGAVTQACRGLNGFVNLLNKVPIVIADSKAKLLPAVFTTARLWASTIDVSLADLQSGQMNLQSAGMTEQDWILYEYRQSPGLKHALDSSQKMSGLDEAMRREYTRTIPIVQPKGILPFLHWLRNSLYGD